MAHTKAETERMMMLLFSNQREQFEILLAQRWLENIEREVERLERVTASYATQPGFSLIH